MRTRPTSLIVGVICITCTFGLALPACLAQEVQAKPIEGPRHGITLTQLLPIDAAARDALNLLIAAALANNPEIHSMEQSVEESRAHYLQSTLRPNPSLQIDGDSDIEAPRGADRGIAVSYSHVFETAGRRERRMEVAGEGVAIAGYQLAERRRNVAGQLARVVLNMLLLDRAISVQEELADATAELVEIVRARVDEGETAAIELNQARVEDSQIAANLQILQGRRLILREEIRRLAGFGETEVRVEGQVELRESSFGSEELLVQALSGRPDLKMLNAELEQARSQIELFKAERVPNITGFLVYSFSRSAFDLNGLDARGNLQPIREVDHAVSGGITFEIPVRDRNQGRLAAAAARVQSVQFQTRALEARIRQEVMTAFELLSSAHRSLSIIQEQVLEQAMTSLNALQEAYQLGEVPFADVLNEQRRLLDLQGSYNDLLEQYAGAAADLADATAAPLP